MSLFCNWLPKLLTTFFLACPTSHPSIGAQDTRPDDFRVEYHWVAGSLPPPGHYEYTITITSSGQSKMVLIPDYRGAGVPEWTEQFHVEEPNVHDLYEVMVKNGLFTQSWRKRDMPPVPWNPGGGSATLVIIARGNQFTDKDYSGFWQEWSSNVMRAAVRTLVPKNLWKQLEARREQYIEEYQRRCRGHHDEHKVGRGC